MNAEAHIVYFLDPITGESNVELEEAFFTTQKLPYQLQLKGGQFFTEFGRINPQHPHQWDWQDQPVINTRLFGPDGMRGPGFRLSWLTPLPWFSELYFGMQNANGETMASFLSKREVFAERPIGGRPFVNRDVKSLKDLAYLARWGNSWDLSDEVSAVLGFSGLYGPNATGPDGETWIYGADLKLKWRPVNNFRGWPFLLFQSEIMGRNYRADRFFNPGPDGIRARLTISACPERPLWIGDFIPSCSGDFERTGLPGSGTSMQAEAETTSMSISEPVPLQSFQEIPIPSGVTGTASLLCSYGSPRNFPVFGCSIIMIG